MYFLEKHKHFTVTNRLYTERQINSDSSFKSIIRYLCKNFSTIYKKICLNRLSKLCLGRYFPVVTATISGSSRTYVVSPTYDASCRFGYQLGNLVFQNFQKWWCQILLYLKFLGAYLFWNIINFWQKNLWNRIYQGRFNYENKSKNICIDIFTQIKYDLLYKRILTGIYKIIWNLTVDKIVLLRTHGKSQCLK